MIEPNPVQLLILSLVLIGGIVSIILGFTVWYARDCMFHPEKHKDDFKPRTSNNNSSKVSKK